MTQRPTGARFCEVCRFDFSTRSSFSGLSSVDVLAQPASAMTLPTAPVQTTVTVPTPASTPSQDTRDIQTINPAIERLQLRIVVDPSLNKDPDPASPCPIGEPDRVFHLDLVENTLGRQYEGNGIHPEIVVQDPGISRRHLKFIRDASGQFTVLELGSANGTEFNAKTLEVGVMTIVKPGDQLTLGMWTRVHVLAR